MTRRSQIRERNRLWRAALLHRAARRRPSRAARRVPVSNTAQVPAPQALDPSVVENLRIYAAAISQLCTIAVADIDMITTDGIPPSSAKDDMALLLASISTLNSAMHDNAVAMVVNGDETSLAVVGAILDDAFAAQQRLSAAVARFCA